MTGGLSLARMNNMVYPGMFRDGPDGHSQGPQQHDQDQGNMNPSMGSQGQGSANFDPQMMAAMQAQMQGGQGQGQGQGGPPHQHGGGPPGMGGHGAQQGMQGMPPGSLIEAHSRRTQSIINAALAAANTPGGEGGGGQYPEQRGGPPRGMNHMDAARMGGGGGPSGDNRTNAPGPGGGAGMNSGGPPPGMPNPYGMGPQGMGGYPRGGYPPYPTGGGGPAQFNSGGPQGPHGGRQGGDADAYLHAKQMQMAAAAGLPPAAVQGLYSYAMEGKESKRKMGYRGNEPPLPTSKIRRTKKASSASKKNQSPKKRAKTFPEKLMQAMSENPNEDAVAWLPDGKSFVVVRPNQFVDLVLKKVFKECKYSSFVRKLHRWGFVRLTSGTGTDCFHHPLFQKNRTDLCLLISCTPRDSKGEPKVNSAIIAAGLQNEKPPSLAGVEKFIRNALSKSIAPPPIPTSTDKEAGKEQDALKKEGQDDDSKKPVDGEEQIKEDPLLTLEAGNDDAENKDQEAGDDDGNENKEKEEPKDKMEEKGSDSKEDEA